MSGKYSLLVSIVLLLTLTAISSAADVSITVEDLFGDSGSLANWTIVDEGSKDGPSNWQVLSGELTEPSNIYGPSSSSTDHRKGTFVYWNDPNSLFWADYKFDVSLRNTDNDGIGVMFRYQDPNNYYKFDMDSQRGFRKLFKMYNGVETTLAVASSGYTVGQQMQLSVDVLWNQIDILLDGVNVFGSSITDSDIPSGTAGLYDWGSTKTYFDNFKVDVTRLTEVSITVEDLFGDSGSLANWTIVDEGDKAAPSNWQVLSGELTEPSNIYSGSSIDHRKGTYVYWNDPNSLFWADYKFDVSLRNKDDDGIGVMFRYQDPNNYYKFDMDSQRGFRKLFKMCNGVETTLASVTVTPGFPLNTQMQLSIDVLGNQIDILLDGVNVFGSAITDSDLPSGTTCLYDWGSTLIYFDNFKVDVTRLRTDIKTIIANDDDYYIFQNEPLQVTSSNGLLVNDTVASGTLTANLISYPQHGDITFNTDGTFSYTPDVNYAGRDSFVYEAVADNADTDQATVFIRVRSMLEFSIVILPDTQNYSTSHPEIFNSQTQWIVDNKDILNIVFVLHEGDITNHNNVAEFNNARAAMSILDGFVPYVIIPGNHDTGAGGGSATRDCTLFNQYFPASLFSSSLGGVYEPNHMENSYHYFTAGGTDWLVFGLEFGPRNKILDWVNGVITANPHRRVIIVTHNYMYSDDTRVGTGDTWNPHTYSLCSGVTEPNTCNDGEEMWTNCVKLHENISFVFSGHILYGGTGTLVSTGDYGNSVYQMLANYQEQPNGGDGWLRIITFYPEQQKVAVQTYSPYLDEYKTTEDQQFEFFLLTGNPNPISGATNVALNKVLSWTSGYGAVSYDVYLGTDVNAVRNAERLEGDLDGDGRVDYNDIHILANYWLENPAGSEPYAGVNYDNIVDFADYALLMNNWMVQGSPLFKGNTTDTSYDDPCDFALNTTYYWRVDEVNGTENRKGDVWSFTTLLTVILSSARSCAAIRAGSTARATELLATGCIGARAAAPLHLSTPMSISGLI